MIYCIDTSSLITGWNDRYPPEIFPGLWEHFEGLIEIEKLIAPEEVYFELEKQDDSIKSWVDKNKILKKHLNLIDLNRTSNQADPFVIALALQRNGIVVTEEKWTNSPKRTKIPNVCEAYNVQCIDLINMIRQLKWKF